METWKPIVGFEGYYEVSDLGRVRRIESFVQTGIKHNQYRTVKERLLKQHKKRNGYFTVDLSKNNTVKTITVHKLVATAFLHKEDGKTEVNHINGNKAVVTFEDLTPQEAQALAGHDLYLPLDLLPKLTGNQFYFHEVKGFRVIDAEKGDIGIIQSIIEYPAQPLFQIMKGDTEILIPVIDPVIKKVDREAKTIFIEAPNGLIDLYLQS